MGWWVTLKKEGMFDMARLINKGMTKKYIHITDEEGRVWRQYSSSNTAIKKNKTAIIEAYNNGNCEQVMRLEHPYG